MATEKTILSVDLYDNVLTEAPGDYTGKIRITGTLRNAELAQRIVKERTGNNGVEEYGNSGVDWCGNKSIEAHGNTSVPIPLTKKC